jgi:hypothetical protein
MTHRDGDKPGKITKTTTTTTTTTTNRPCGRCRGAPGHGDHVDRQDLHVCVQGELVTEEMSANPIFSNSVKFN